MAQDTTGWCAKIQDGGDYPNVTAPAAVVGGVPFVKNGMFFIPRESADSGASVSCDVEGIWLMPKDAPLVINAGDQVFWNDTDKEVTKTATDTPIGKCMPDYAAASADTTVRVLLQPGGADAMDVITDHIADTVGAHAATAIAFTPTGTIAATTTQAAVAEVSGDVTAHVGNTSAAHAATAISIAAPAHYTETDVGALLTTLAAKVYALEHP